MLFIELETPLLLYTLDEFRGLNGLEQLITSCPLCEGANMLDTMFEQRVSSGGGKRWGNTVSLYIHSSASWSIDVLYPLI